MKQATIIRTRQRAYRLGEIVFGKESSLTYRSGQIIDIDKKAHLVLILWRRQEEAEWLAPEILDQTTGNQEWLWG